MSLYAETQMQGMSSEEQAKKAILHLLRRINDDPYIGWYLGFGTQSFSLLTEAYSTLTNQPVEQVREEFEPVNPRNPKEDAQ